MELKVVDLRKLAQQIASHAKRGDYGAQVQTSAVAYAQLPSDLARALVCANEIYADNLEGFRAVDPELADSIVEIRDRFIQLFLVIYRDAKKKNPGIALEFANAFHRDLPGAQGSALLPKWKTLADACHAFRQTAQSGSSVLVWQQSKALLLAWHEFLDGLLGPMIYAWRTALGKKASIGIVGQTYGVKANEFRDLTGGDDGRFYIIHRLTDPVLRNGLAHGSAWLDEGTNVVHYTNGKQDKVEHSIAFLDFMAHAMIASRLCQAYCAALGVVVVAECDCPQAQSSLPEHLVRLLKH